MNTNPLQQAKREQAAVVADNLLRIMVDRKLNLGKVSELTGVDERTIRSLRTGKRAPSMSTYNKIAEGLEIDSDELLKAKLSDEELFDRSTNPEAAAFVDANPKLFRGWNRDEYTDFFSRFGVGGGQTDDGARHAATFINDRRDVVRKVLWLMETPSAETLTTVVEQMCKREQVTG